MAEQMVFDADQVTAEVAEGIEKIQNASNLEELKAIKTTYAGADSAMTKASKAIGSLPADQKKEAGKLMGKLRADFGRAYGPKEVELKEAAEKAALAAETVDMTLPVSRKPLGARHPLPKLMEDVEDFFISMGWQISSGPEIEAEWYNFDSLNFGPDHPARQMQDTFYVKGNQAKDAAGFVGSNMVVRTQTSSDQVRALLTRGVPLYIASPGRVFRTDELDATHTPVFHQCEALAVDKHLTMADLKGVLDKLAVAMFGPEAKTRLRPSYFPFTEPSAELDLWFPDKKGGPGWLEWGGCGMVMYAQPIQDCCREIIRQVEAVPTFRVTRHYTDQETARHATQAKEIYGYLVIPNQFEADATAGRDATLSYYYHYALLSVGGEVRGAFETLLRTLSLAPVVVQATAMGLGENQITTFLLPVRSSSHPLFNPDLDYSVYLSNPFFFVFFQVIILLVTVYAIGSEIKFRTGDEWLEAARMNMFVAVVGKLLPYTIIFCIMSVFANYIMFGVMHIPFACGFWPLNLTAILFVVATQALAVFLFSLFPAIAIVISVVSMVGSLGATLCGVTFPVDSMYAPVHYASYLFPVRHFVEINQNLLYGDYGFPYTWVNVSSLFAFMLLALVLLPHLKTAILSHKYENIR